jgi:hypothetical protein
MFHRAAVGHIVGLGDRHGNFCARVAMLLNLLSQVITFCWILSLVNVIYIDVELLP